MSHNNTHFQYNLCNRLVCTTNFVMKKYDRRRRSCSGFDRQHCRFPSSSLPVAVPSGSTGRRQSPLRAQAKEPGPLAKGPSLAAPVAVPSGSAGWQLQMGPHSSSPVVVPSGRPGCDKVSTQHNTHLNFKCPSLVAHGCCAVWKRRAM